MTNQELIQVAIAAGFDESKVGLATASDGEPAVILPRNIGALEELEATVPTLVSVGDRFHQWLVRDNELETLVETFDRDPDAAYARLTPEERALFDAIYRPPERIRRDSRYSRRDVI